jgi:hypothetical protein
MKTLKILSIILLFSLSSCSLQKGYLKLTNQSNDEIISTEAIKEHMKKHPKTSIVLKAPFSEDKSTQSDLNSGIYNAIEKELLLAGFDVKDRGLFNEVVSKSKDINYDEIRKLTGTDLILELVRINNDVKYTTNQYYQKDDKPVVLEDTEFSRPGAIVEFKLTLIESNQSGGSYTFNYVPCKEKTKDCYCEVAYKKALRRVYPHLSFCQGPENKNKEAFESVSQDIMINLVRDGVKKMINEIKQ